MPCDPTFTHNILSAFGVAGQQWLAALPALLKAAAERWDLTLGEPFPLSYNYVCRARRADGSQVVLKVGLPHRELASELQALRLFDGQGACRLLEADPQGSAFLLERLRPGARLASLADDEARTEIAAELMLRLWRVPQEAQGLILLRDWFAELNKLRPRYRGGCGPFPQWLVERVRSTLPALFADAEGPVLLHGDLHHFNILSSERGWLAIDPKGVLGPRGYEVGPLLINPLPSWPYRRESVRQTRRRIAILSERLGWAPETVREWGLCHCLLSAWWSLTPEDTGSEYAVACADVLAQAT